MQFALKKLQTDMAKPSKASWRRLKKFLRYMKGTECYENRIEVDYDEFMKFTLDGYSDTDWAKEKITRKA